MKYVKYFLLATMAIICSSFSTSGTSRLSESIYPGNPFPCIKDLKNTAGTKFNLSDLKGQKVLVVFWAAYDAESRKNNVLFSNTIRINNYPVKQVSLSFDKSEAIFNGTLSIDGLDNEYQFMAKENSRELIRAYQLEDGFKNYLIDEVGNVIAINLEADELDNYLKRT